MRAPGVETVHIRMTGGQIAPLEALAALARRGMRRILIEGGADTVSRFVAADAVDRLHVMVAPLIVGSGRPGLTLAPVAELVHARRPLTATYPLPGGDVLFDCDLRREAEAQRHQEEMRHEPADDGLGRLYVDR